MFLSIRSRRRWFRPIIVIALAVVVVAILVAKARAESPSGATWHVGTAGRLEPRVAKTHVQARLVEAGTGTDSPRAARR